MTRFGCSILLNFPETADEKPVEDARTEDGQNSDKLRCRKKPVKHKAAVIVAEELEDKAKQA